VRQDGDVHDQAPVPGVRKEAADSPWPVPICVRIRYAASGSGWTNRDRIGRWNAVDQRNANLEKVAALSGMLGFLNFSAGKPDPRFQKQLNDAYTYLAGQGIAEPWNILHAELNRKLDALEAGESSAFRDATQARAVLSLVLTRFMPAYRQHHEDLLF